MTVFFRNLAQIMRRLAHAPLFTAITLLTLAIGVGANTVIFSVIEAVLLKPLPYPNADRLIGLWYTAPGINIKDLTIAPSVYFIDREQSTTLEDVGAFNGDSFSVTGSGEPEHVRGLDVTDGVLPMLGAQPAAGRLFTRTDDSPSAPQTAMLSYAYWQQKFGGATSVIGSTITLDGKARQIVGVLPRGFHLLDNPDASIVIPMQWDRSKTKLGNFSYQAIARLKPGVTLQQASTDMARLLPVTIRSFPAPDGFSADLFAQAKIGPNLRPLKQDVVGNVGSVLWVLMGSIALVLMVACANVANLLLVRVEGRRQELAIRAALGAPWSRIAGELLLESLTLGIAGSLFGLGLASVALRAIIAAAPTGLPRIHEISLDSSALLFTLGLAILTSLLIGAIPVLKYAGARATSGLREGGRALSQSRERHRARKILVVVQVALALVLLICSGLMIRTFQALTHVDLGFTGPDSLLTFRCFIPESQIPDDQADRILHQDEEIANKLAALPGVQSASFGNGVPMDGYSNNDVLFTQDHVLREGQIPPVRRFKNIAPGFISTIGAHLIAGRDYTWADEYSRHPIVLVSEGFARENWGTAGAAIGKKIRVASTDDWREIVGVIGDIHDDGADQPVPATIYWPLMMDNFEGEKHRVDRSVSFVIRSSRAGSQAFFKEVQQQVWSVSGSVPLADPTTVGELYAHSLARTVFTLILLSIAGAMALLLGILGLYGVIAYTISQRTREIGIRMALGAQRSELTALFVRQGMMLTAIGAACGLVLAFATMRLMRSILFNVSPVDPLTYIGITVIMLATAALACYLPSRRAATVDPMNALRSE
jgi:predicted permease